MFHERPLSCGRELVSLHTGMRAHTQTCTRIQLHMHTHTHVYVYTHISVHAYAGVTMYNMDTSVHSACTHMHTQPRK